MHRSSFAPPHLFKSIPYSQFRRATIICSNDQNRESQYTRIKNKLLNSGYTNNELNESIQKAVSINRDQILNVKVDPILNSAQCETPTENNNNRKVMSFITQFNSHTSIFRNFFNKNVNDLNNIIGEHQIIMANRKNRIWVMFYFQGKNLLNHLSSLVLMPLAVLDV